VDPMAEGCQTPRPPLDMPMSRTSWIDSDYTDEAARPIVSVESLLGVQCSRKDRPVMASRWEKAMEPSVC
jgi:hypothetical protein